MIREVPVYVPLHAFKMQDSKNSSPKGRKDENIPVLKLQCYALKSPPTPKPLVPLPNLSPSSFLPPPHHPLFIRSLKSAEEPGQTVRYIPYQSHGTKTS